MQTTQSKLQTAAEGLWMMSESDYPFDFITTNASVINDELALKLADKPVGTTVEVITLDYLLRNLTDASVGSVPIEDALKFQNLANTLKNELENISVYRVGKVQVDVFILGTTAEGVIAGMRTKLIET
jgi:hypothetical protein